MSDYKYCDFQTPCGMCRIQSQFFGYKCPYWRDNGPVVKLKMDETKEAENEQTTD